MEQKLIDFIIQNENSDINKLILSQSKYPDIDVLFAATNIKGREKSKSKIPTWHNNPNIVYPNTLSLEQCSSEISAQYKTRFVTTDDTICDLTGGLGVDSYFLSKRVKHLIYYEQNSELAQCAKINFGALDASNITVKEQTIDNNFIVNQLKDQFDLIYIDPARRGSRGEKVVSITDCEPNLLVIKDALFNITDKILVKLSPMADISSTFRLLPECCEIHIVSVNNECKELLFLLQKGSHLKYEYVTHYTINLYRDKEEYFNFTIEDERSSHSQYSEMINEDDYLYVPNKSILKGGGFKYVGIHYSLTKLAMHTHLYISNKLNKEFPGKIYKVIEILGTNKLDIKKIAKNYPLCSVSAINIHESSDNLRKKLRVKEGEDYHIFGTKLENGKTKLIITSPIKLL